MQYDSDSDNEQMRQAIALSLQQHQHETQNASAAQSDNRLGDLFTQRLDDVDRENEDIRKAIALSLGKPVEQLTAREALGLVPGVKRSLTDDSGPTVGQDASKKPSAGLPRYWDGVVKLTHVTGFTGPNFIRFEEIVQKVKLQILVFWIVLQ
ncbi:hypothetical protein BJV82DRAFT_252278 [Fennellomyces sp. T-0311]|nr:hypothetical protein BJV82DRAFT_252278 [Fennellomyces sp. T-0311]